MCPKLQVIHRPQVNNHVSMNLQELLRPLDFPGGTSGKEPACQLKRLKRLRFDPLVRKILLEEGMAAHSRVLA